MKITIDTKEDSAEEIRKAIQLLSSFINGEYPHTSANIFENPLQSSPGESQPINAFGAMFGDNAPSSQASNPVSSAQERPKSFPLDDIPRIVPY